jgi:transcriptional regulator with XRE-family HTH domain
LNQTDTDDEGISRAQSGQRIKAAREAAGWPSARAAARQLGMESKNYNKIETGETVPLWTSLVAILEGLDLDPRIVIPEVVRFIRKHESRQWRRNRKSQGQREALRVAVVAPQGTEAEVLQRLGKVASEEDRDEDGEQD